MIAIDWSHTKGLTTFDGKKVKVETLRQLLKRLSKDGSGEESNQTVKSKKNLHSPEPDSTLGEESKNHVESTQSIHSPSIVIEQGAPVSLLYQLILAGAQVFVISNRATEDYRREFNIEKTDENDARIIYNLANNGAKLQPISLDDKAVQMADVYNQYCRYQKARVSLQNMRKAHKRHYGISGAGESNSFIKSTFTFHLVPDLSPYDIAIEALHGREKTLLKRLEVITKGLPLFEAGGESIVNVESKAFVHPPAIKGLGTRLWLGLMVTANPSNFPCLSAYLRFCGLTGDVIKSHKYNRHAKMLYHLLAEETMKQRDPKYRPLYDKIKEELKVKFPDYTKGHIHNATLNRVATFLAKDILKGGNYGQ